MNRARYEVGREPPQPDLLRQVPVNSVTTPEPAVVERVRRTIALHRARMNALEASRENPTQRAIHYVIFNWHVQGCRQLIRGMQ